MDGCPLDGPSSDSAWLPFHNSNTSNSNNLVLLLGFLVWTDPRFCFWASLFGWAHFSFSWAPLNALLLQLFHPSPGQQGQWQRKKSGYQQRQQQQNNKNLWWIIYSGVCINSGICIEITTSDDVSNEIMNALPLLRNNVAKKQFQQADNNQGIPFGGEVVVVIVGIGPFWK